MPISEQGPPAAAWVKHEGLYYWIEGERSHRKVYQMYLEGKVGPHDRPTEEIMKCEQGSPNADWAGKETEERQALCQAQAAARTAQQFEAKAAAETNANFDTALLHQTLGSSRARPPSEWEEKL